MSIPSNITSLTAPSKLDPAEIALKLQQAVELEHQSDINNYARQLIAAAKEQHVSVVEPLNIVRYVIDALRKPFAKNSLPLIMQVLHHYLDLSVLQSLDERNKDDGETKEVKKIQINAPIENYLSVLENFSGVKNQTAEMCYAYDCSRNALIILADMSMVVEVLKVLVQILRRNDIGEGIKLIRACLKEKTDKWYPDVLLIRSLIPIAQKSIHQCRELQKFIAEVSIYASKDWQLIYAVLEALHEIVIGGKHSVQMMAFLGEDPDLILNKLPPSLRFFVDLLFHPSSDRVAGHHQHYRLAKIIVDLCGSAIPWIRQEAMAIYHEIYARDSNRQFLEIYPVVKLPEVTDTKRIRDLQKLQLEAWACPEKLLATPAPSSRESSDPIGRILNATTKYLTDLAEAKEEKHKGALVNAREQWQKLILYITQKELTIDEVYQTLPLLHLLIQNYLANADLTKVNECLQSFAPFVTQLSPGQQLNYFIKLADQYAGAGYPQPAAEYYLKALTLAERADLAEEIRQVVIQDLQVSLGQVYALGLFQSYYPLLEQRLIGNAIPPNFESLTFQLRSIAPVADLLAQYQLFAAVDAFYTLLAPWTKRYVEAVIHKTLQTLQEELKTHSAEQIVEKIETLLQLIQPVLEQWLCHGQYALADPCYTQLLEFITAAQHVNIILPAKIKESVNFGVAQCADKRYLVFQSNKLIRGYLPSESTSMLVTIPWYSARQELKNFFQQLTTFTQQPTKTLALQNVYSRSVKAWLGKRLTEIEKLLGKPPCGFAVLVLGALSDQTYCPGMPITLALLIEKDFYRHDAYFKALSQIITLTVNGLGDGLVQVDAQYLSAECMREEQRLGTPQALIARFHPDGNKDPRVLAPLYRSASLYAADASSLFSTFQTELTRVFNKISETPLASGPIALSDSSESKALSRPLVRQQFAERYLMLWQQEIERSAKEKRLNSNLCLSALDVWCFGIAVAQAIQFQGEDAYLLLDKKFRFYLHPAFIDLVHEAIVFLREQQLTVAVQVAQEWPLQRAGRFEIASSNLWKQYEEVILPAYLSRTAWIQANPTRFNVDPLHYNFTQLVQVLNNPDSQKLPANEIIDQVFGALIHRLIKQKVDATTHRNYYHLVPSLLKERYWHLLKDALQSPDCQTIAPLIYDIVGLYPRSNGERLAYIEKARAWDQLMHEQLTQDQSEEKEEKTIEVSWITPDIKQVTRHLKREIHAQLLAADKAKPLIPLALNDEVVAYACTRPTLPGLNREVNKLYWRLTGNGIQSTLIKLSPSDSATPVVVALFNPVGKPLRSYASATDLQHLEANLDRYAYTLKFLATFLIGPTKEGPDYLMAEEFINVNGEKTYRLVSINDNNLWCYDPATTQIQRSMLYCFKRQMLSPLDPAAVAEFLTLHSSSCLKHWLSWAQYFDDKTVGNSSTGVKGLFSIEERNAGFSEIQTQSCFIPFRLEPGLVQRLYRRFERIQALLRRYETPLTPLELLSALEPQLGKYYQVVLQKFADPFQRYAAMCDPAFIRNVRSEMKAERSVTENKESDQQLRRRVERFYRPQDALDQELLDLDEKASTVTLMLQKLLDGDKSDFRNEKIHIFLKEEVVRQLGKRLSTLSPEKQRELLRAMVGIPFQTLDLSYWTELNNDLLKAILNKAPDLQSLNVRGCRRLTAKGIRAIERCKELEELDLSDLPDLTAVSDKILGFEANLNFPQLDRLSINACPALILIEIRAPKLQSLSLQGCIKLQRISTQNSQYTAEEKDLVMQNSGGLGAFQNALLFYTGEKVQRDAARAFEFLIQALSTTGYTVNETEFFVNLLQAIDQNRIREANFSNHEISLPLLQFIVQVAIRSESLNDLNLQATELDKAAVRPLIMLLRYNSNIQKLDLRGNALPAKDLQQFDKIIGRLVHLELDEKTWQSSEAVELRRTLALNQARHYHDSRQWTTLIVFAACCKTKQLDEDPAKDSEIFLRLAGHVLSYVEYKGAKPSVIPLAIQSRFFTAGHAAQLRSATINSASIPRALAAEEATESKPPANTLQ